MKYYVIAGEASGDLHASHLMTYIMKEDKEAQFRFIGGDNMLSAAAERGTMLTHYRELAYMGFIPVLLHLPAILRGMKQCKRDIEAWQPDVVILVDYAGFNLKIAKYIKQRQLPIKTVYYIAPKIWAWKEYRIKDFRRYVDEMLCILPFEKEFFEVKHHYPVHYVGNPTADEVRAFVAEMTPERNDAFLESNGIAGDKGIIALLCGSRRQEIKDNLPAMLEAVKTLKDDYQIVIAGAPAIEHEYYEPFMKGHDVRILHGQTYPLLYNATAALVTSGTATLETAMFGVPQVVCYKTPLPMITRWAFDHVIKCRYISLVNLIAGKEVVKELFAEQFSVANIEKELRASLPGGAAREQMLSDYARIKEALGDCQAPAQAAKVIDRIAQETIKRFQVTP